MRDRTRELNQGGSRSSEEDEEEAKVALMGLSPPGDDTLRQAQGVRAALATLEQKLEALEEQQERVLGTPVPPDGLKQELQTLREEIQVLTQQIRVRLRALEPGREEEEEGDEGWGSIGARVKRTQHGVLAQQFLALTGRCHAAQAQYRQRSLDRIRRQLHIAGSTSVTEEELEQMLESGQSEVFISNVLGATRATRAALEEVGVRHRELQRLEKGLRDLGELFGLLSTTLEGQGEVIDRIERNIAASGARLEKGRQRLSAAQRGRGRARRRKLLAIACVTVTVLVLIGLLGGLLGS